MDKSKLYIIENKSEGCFQIALKKGNQPDPANDELIDCDCEVVEYEGEEG